MHQFIGLSSGSLPLVMTVMLFQLTIPPHVSYSSLIQSLMNYFCRQWQCKFQSSAIPLHKIMFFSVKSYFRRTLQKFPYTETVLTEIHTIEAGNFIFVIRNFRVRPRKEWQGPCRACRVTYRNDFIRGAVHHLVKLQHESRWNPIAILNDGWVLFDWQFTFGGGVLHVKVGALERNWKFDVEGSTKNLLGSLCRGGWIDTISRSPWEHFWRIVEFYVELSLHEV